MLLCLSWSSMHSALSLISCVVFHWLWMHCALSVVSCLVFHWLWICCFVCRFAHCLPFRFFEARARFAVTATLVAISATRCGSFVLGRIHHWFQCGQVLDADQLLHPTCKLCGSTPEFKTSPHLFLDLPKMSNEACEWFKRASKTGGWSPNSIRTTESWFKMGLKER